MPIYEYRCTDCRHSWEVLLLGRTAEPTRCPSCGGDRVVKVPSAPYVARGTTGHGEHTCCGRAERCDSPPCSGGGGCQRG
mgnify:CR=1 FL=1